ncbi:MAG: hypothetical protein JWR19_1044 [Pedosphaera sp.]|nr:hypothetical protein [Pedosphaera sp.]
MSTSPEQDFDLEKLFLPAWAQESPTVNRYAKYAGDDRPNRDSKFDDRRGPRRGGPPPRRDGGGPGAPRGDSRAPRRDQPGGGPRPGGDRGPRPGGPGGPGGPRGNFRRDDRGGDRRDRPEQREAPLPLPALIVSFTPDDKGVESLARQIKISGRSFPLFDIAQMILQKPERHLVRFEIEKKPDGTAIQPLFLCALDDTLWLSEDETVSHVLEKHFGMFYQAEKTATEPPKGTYTFVAQCGMSGVILGPPNYHDYQNQLRKLHTEQFSRMPFDMFKARVKIVKDEAVVKKWIEDQSVKTEFVCLNVPEATRLNTREDVEKHFRAVHLASIIKPVEKHHTLNGAVSRQLRSQGLQRLVRAAWEDQKRFPLQIATVLSQQFASHGLQFFKVNKTVTHVSVARPHYLDLETTPVSAQVKQIVQFIDSKPKCTRRLLVQALAPSPVAPKVAAAPAPAPAAEAGAAPVAPAPAAEPEPTAEQAAIVGDLHWLIHQGHVIEFANGILETAKKPIIKPPKPPKAEAPAPAPVAATAAAANASNEAAPVNGTTTEPVPVEPAEPAAPIESAPVETPAAM